MLTEQHFEALAKVREESNNLRLACIAAEETGSLLHMSFDRGATLHNTSNQTALLNKLRAVQ